MQDLQKLARTYAGMIERCYNEKSKSYKDYGGRGIEICESWINSPGDFFTWCKQFGDTTGLHLDRIDNNQGYSPDNCRFITPTENVRNRRNTIMLTAWQETKPMAAWAEDERCPGVSWRTIRFRIERGWAPEDAISIPSRQFKNLDSKDKIESITKGHHPNDPVHTAFGENKTLAEWSRDSRCVVGKKELWSRINRGWSVEDSLTKPAAANSGLVFEGKSIFEWSRDLNCEVSYNTLSRRLKNGESVQEAMKKRSTPRGRAVKSSTVL